MRAEGALTDMQGRFASILESTRPSVRREAPSVSIRVS